MSDFLDQLVAKGKAVKKADGAYELLDANALSEKPIIKIMLIASLAYKAAYGIPEDRILEQYQVEAILMTWMCWTRSVPENDPRFRDARSQSHDWWMLGIINADASVNESEVRRIADWIWAHEDETPDCSRLLEVITGTSAPTVPKSSSAQKSAPKRAKSAAPALPKKTAGKPNRAKTKAARKAGRKARQR